MSFRKLSNDELNSYGIPTENCAPQILKTYLDTYFKGWARCVVVLNAEYNDEYYNHSTKCVIAFDAEGNEIVPDKTLSIEARKEVPDAYDLGVRDEESEDEIEDLVFIASIPDLYVKE